MRPSKAKINQQMNKSSLLFLVCKQYLHAFFLLKKIQSSKEHKIKRENSPLYFITTSLPSLEISAVIRMMSIPSDTSASMERYVTHISVCIGMYIYQHTRVHIFAFIYLFGPTVQLVRF